MTERKSLLGTVVAQYGSIVAVVVCGFVQSVIVARSLGPTTLGFWAAITAIVSIVFQLLSPRLHEAVIRFAIDYRNADDGEGVWAVVRLSFVVDAVSGCFAGAVAFGIGWLSRSLVLSSEVEPALMATYGATLAWTVAATFLSSVGNATAIGILRVLDAARAQAFITAAVAVLRLVSYAIVLHLGFGLSGLVPALAVVALLSTGALLAMAWSRLRARYPSARGDIGRIAPRLREMGRFSRSTWLFSVLQVPTKDLDVSLLPLFVPLASVGDYKVAKSLMSAVWLIADPVFTVVYPELADLWVRRQLSSLRTWQRKLTLGFGGLGALAAAACFALVPTVLPMVFGHKFDRATPLFLTMVALAVPWFAFCWVQPMLVAAGRPDLSVRSVLASATVTIAGLALVAPRYGALGAALVTGSASLAAVLVGLLQCKRIGALPPAAATDKA